MLPFGIPTAYDFPAILPIVMTSPSLRPPQVVPHQLANKWVAWTPNGLYIVGSGVTPQEARQAAATHGPDPSLNWAPSMGVGLEWVPPADQRFLGPACR
jgi:hypothetical protein